jgi:phosphohistidine phosphatase
MKRLLLLRHAKAVQGTGDDRARALTARGRSNAAALGAFLHRSGERPQAVLCSTAKRTVETWELVAAELGAPAQAEFLDQLYLASAKKIQSILRNAGDAAQTILAIGHNPGMEDCAAELARKPASKDEAWRLASLTEKFPTCGLAVLEFDVARWADVAAGTGVFVAFVRPKDLE